MRHGLSLSQACMPTWSMRVAPAQVQSLPQQVRLMCARERRPQLLVVLSLTVAVWLPGAQAQVCAVAAGSSPAWCAAHPWAHPAGPNTTACVLSCSPAALTDALWQVAAETPLLLHDVFVGDAASVQAEAVLAAVSLVGECCVHAGAMCAASLVSLQR